MYRILIADDEPIECRALQHKLEHRFPEIFHLRTACNGIDLIQKVEEYDPDIVIADINMPGLSGLDAIEILKAKKEKLKIIIHTAYSQFDYAKRAIDLGAAAYILKPDVDDEMFQTVKKLFDELETETKDSIEQLEEKKEMKNLRDIAAKKWLTSLYVGKEDKECRAVFQKTCPQLQYGAFLSVWNFQQKVSDEVVEKVILSMKKLSTCVAIKAEKEILFLIILKERENYRKLYREICLYIFETLFTDVTKVSVGVSSWKEKVQDFREGIKEASVEARMTDPFCISFFEYKNGRTSAPDVGQMVCEFIPELQRGETEACIAKVWESIRDFEPEEQKAFVFLWMYETEEQMSANDWNVQKNWKFWKDFAFLETTEGLLKWLETGLTAADVSKPVKLQNGYIEKTCLFLTEHYAQDLSLEQVCEKVGISYFYLSRLLKQELNVSFSEMLTQIRIFQSILFMKDPQRTVKEIGEEVGYMNTTYFYKVFKKNTGISVGTMRKIISDVR